MSWRDTPFAQTFGMRLPVIQAPMAGGLSTPRLAAAVCEAGGLGSIAGAMLSPDDLRAAIREVRSLTHRPFAVNLFTPLPEPSGDRVAEWAALTGVAPAPRTTGPRFEDQLAVVIEENVWVVSFTFGIPSRAILDTIPPGPARTIEELTSVMFAIGTATTVAEAVAFEQAGIRAVVVQGYEAGGHRGTFLEPVQHSLLGTMTLVPQVVDAVRIPVIASGGIMDGRGIAAALSLGAQAVQLGTAFLRSAEAGTSEAHRAAVSRETTITNVLTGRYARAVRTPLVDRLESSGLEPPDYPLPRSLSPEPPWLVGQGGPMARSLPAADLLAALEVETDAAIARLA